MAKPGNQKLKILYILRLLENSDAHHPVTMKTILEVLGEHGIPAERKGIYDDMDALRDFGYEIVGMRGRNAGYYLEKKPGKDRIAVEAVSDAAEYFWLEGEEEIHLLCGRDAAEQIKRELGEAHIKERKEKKKKSEGEELILAGTCGPEFFGWLAGKGIDVRLINPAGAVKEFRRYLKEIRNLYKS